VRELERELAITARAVGERAVKAKTVDETVMVKLLDQYSERLVQLLDEKISISVKQQVRQNSEGSISSPVAKSPVLRKEAEHVEEPEEMSAPSSAGVHTPIPEEDVTKAQFGHEQRSKSTA
jgi:hypothetical protein